MQDRFWHRSEPDSDTRGAIRRLFPDWDGNPHIIRAALRERGYSAEEIDRMDWPTVRAAIDMTLLCIGRSMATTKGAISEVSVSPPATEPGVPAKEANERVSDYLRRNPNATVREASKACGVSIGAVSQTAAWRAVKGELRKGRRPKTVSLTPRLEATLGTKDDELERLIKEQEADDRADRLGSTYRRRS